MLNGTLALGAYSPQLYHRSPFKLILLDPAPQFMLNPLPLPPQYSYVF